MERGNFETATLHLRRAKGGHRHPSLAGRRAAGAAGVETRRQIAVRVRQRAGCTLHRVRPAEAGRAGRGRGGMPFKVHPHMLRHATGYALANKGIDTRTLQAYLGHRTIQSTVRYTELAPGRFKNLWR